MNRIHFSDHGVPLYGALDTRRKTVSSNIKFSYSSKKLVVFLFSLLGTLDTQRKSISFDIKFSDSSKDVTFTGRYFSGAHKIQSINGQWRTTANKPPILVVFEVDSK